MNRAKLTNSLVSAVIVAVPVLAFLSHGYAMAKDGGVSIAPEMWLLGGSILALGLGVYIITAWLSRWEVNKSGMFYLFTGMLNFGLGMALVLYSAILHQFPQELLFILPLGLNLLIGIAVLVDAYFLKDARGRTHGQA